jgi:ATP-dependent DNA helicase RecG
MTLENIKGLGPKNLNLLNKLGINTTDDLVSFYPFRYDVIERSNINELEDNDKIIIDGIIETIPSIFHFGKRKDKMSFKLNTGLNIFRIEIYNRGFLRPRLKIGTSITVIGKLDKKHNLIVVNDINFGMIKETRIEPIYHTTYGIGINTIRKYINTALLNYKSNSLLPNYLCDKYNFIDKDKAVNIIHNPNNLSDLKKALNRLKYEELFLFMCKMNYLKNNDRNKIGLKRIVDKNKVYEFINTIPFELTKDQLKAIEDIYTDLTEPYRMNRLLQGDVGSGKTIVSFVSLYINYLSGYQGALMAPTEVLAIQHYNNIKELFKDYKINIELLIGKTTKKEKNRIYKELVSGNIDIIIGTHALFTDDAQYKNLGLVITDEQHRFGVNQRANLKNKGITPDVLYMSATPIPRTYALTLYGDMEISNIKTLPNGKKDIITTIESEKNIKNVLENMYKELKEGHQIYVIAPLVEESDKVDFNNVYELEEKMNKAFGKLYNIGVLHGKMKNDEKDEVMTKFKNNEIQILISTTVVEVGIDVKNATMIVIFDAYMFGLSSLHQLRGRVGRNALQSYCILISNHETERLSILTKTNDGFKISEEDFKLRGSGDLFGVKQSGDMVFNLADLKRDYHILLKAKEDSEEFLKDECKVNDNKELLNLIKNNFGLD